MKVFFTTTPRLKDKHDDYVRAIYNAVEELGHVHTSDFLVRIDPEKFYTVNDSNIPNYYDEILSALKKSDVVVFEASLHSIGVGMLLKEALEQGKGAVVLYMEGQFPFLLGGMKEDRLVIDEYNLHSVKAVLHNAFDYLNEKSDTRFNFFIAPKHQQYLDWVAKNKRIPRAVYLRRLIEADMKKNKDFA